MKKAVNHRKPKHKRAKKRKQIVQAVAQKRQASPTKKIEKNLRSKSKQSIKKTNKKTPPKVITMTSSFAESVRNKMMVVFQVFVGIFGFVSGGFVILIKMPFWVTMFVR